MKKCLGFSTIAFALLLSLPGCSEPQNTSVTEGIDQSAVEAYDAAVAEESAGMEEDPPADE